MSSQRAGESTMVSPAERWIYNSLVDQIRKSVGGLVERATNIIAFIEMRNQRGPAWDFHNQLRIRRAQLGHRNGNGNEAANNFSTTISHQPTIEGHVGVEEIGGVPPVQGYNNQDLAEDEIIIRDDLGEWGINPQDSTSMHELQNTRAEIRSPEAEHHFSPPTNIENYGLFEDDPFFRDTSRGRSPHLHPQSSRRRGYADEPRALDRPRRTQSRRTNQLDWMRLHTLREEKSVLEKKLELQRLEAERGRRALHKALDDDLNPHMQGQRENDLLFRAIDEEQHRLDLKERTEGIIAQTRQDLQDLERRAGDRMTSAEEDFRGQNDAIYRLVGRERDVLLARMDSEIDNVIIQMTGTTRIPVRNTGQQRGKSQRSQSQLLRNQIQFRTGAMIPTSGQTYRRETQPAVQSQSHLPTQLQLERNMRKVLAETGFNEREISGIIYSRKFAFGRQPMEKDVQTASSQRQNDDIPGFTGKWRYKMSKGIFKVGLMLRPQDFPHVIGEKGRSARKSIKENPLVTRNESKHKQPSTRPPDKEQDQPRRPNPLSGSIVDTKGHHRNWSKPRLDETRLAAGNNFETGEYEEIQAPRRLLSARTLDHYGLPWKYLEVSPALKLTSCFNSSNSM